MRIQKIYKISGSIIGLTLGLVSLIFTFSIFFSIFGIFLMASDSSLFTPAWLIIIGPLGILVAILAICYRLGSKIGRSFEVDIQNEEINKRRAALVLWASILFLIFGMILFFFGVSSIKSSFKSISEKGRETINAGIAEEKTYEQYAKIGNVNVESRQPFKFSYALNGKLTEVLLFKKLFFNIPVSVSRAGTYEIYVRYSSNSNFYANSKSSPNVRRALDVGDHLVNVEFIAEESPNLGYEMPKSVKGKVSIELNYLTSKKELLDSLKSDSAVEQKVIQQFMKDEGLDQGVSPDSTVNKFVERKEIQF